LGQRVNLILLLDIADQDPLVGKQLGNFLLTLRTSNYQDNLCAYFKQSLGNVSSDTFFVGNAKDNHPLLGEAKKI
jgi:hypothetical protein